MHKVDKSGWLSGPWDHENDIGSWDTPEGFHAIVIRSSGSGAWCGYIGVPPGHPWHGVSYSTRVKPDKGQQKRPVDINEISILSLLVTALSDENPDEGVRLDCLVRAHGGLTYSNIILTSMEGRYGWWYFGFDCSHAGDMSPAMTRYFPDELRYGVYRTEEFVRGEVMHLSEEIAALPLPQFTEEKNGNEQPR